ncbi:cytochrome P450 [Hoeflea prorocentri]|uniref:Cytochrome P450 n=1 Tax=Hoeflea prorocentri TaxID=1922333 RepID=A0A9X3UGV0_9HYPH|nr:cytochrome P450 [Hoeflea prorocentri]MCY6380605.1 cytochrome P450 [Hoeflea prorocentri]MDA5398405.1 cytochrome P450 [Hoeflea prorocentri]
MQFDLTRPSADFIRDPYPTYRYLREQEPICRQADGSIILSRYADLEMVYRDTARFISDKKKVFAPKFGAETPLYEHHTTSLVFNDPPLHTRVRQVMVGAMNPRALKHMEPGLITLVDDLIEQMAQAADVEIIRDFAGAIPIEVIGNLLDLPRAAREPLRDWSLAILGALEPVLTPQQHEEGNRAVSDFVDLLRTIITERRARPGDPDVDVLTRLIQSDTDGGLSEVELYQNCIFILNAGHETTTNLIGNALGLLDQDRDARRQLIANPDLIATAVDEFLRLESPNQFGNRLAADDIFIGGEAVSAGTDLHLCIGAANRDPDQFEEPDRMVLDRRPNRHLAFASGAHTCVGLSLARMEGRIAVGRFLQRFPDYQLTEGGERSGRIRFRGYSRLPAVLQ